MIFDKDGNRVDGVDGMDQRNPFSPLEAKFHKIITNLSDAFNGAKCINHDLVTQAVQDLVQADILATVTTISNLARVGNKTDEEVQKLGLAFANEYTKLLAQELAKDSVKRQGGGNKN